VVCILADGAKLKLGRLLIEVGTLVMENRQDRESQLSSC